MHDLTPGIILLLYTLMVDVSLLILDSQFQKRKTCSELKLVLVHSVSFSIPFFLLCICIRDGQHCVKKQGLFMTGWSTYVIKRYIYCSGALNKHVNNPLLSINNINLGINPNLLTVNVQTMD